MASSDEVTAQQQVLQPEWIKTLSSGDSKSDSTTEIPTAEVIVPSTSHVTRQSAKWDHILPSVNEKGIVEEERKDKNSNGEEEQFIKTSSGTAETDLKRTESYSLMEVLNIDDQVTSSSENSKGQRKHSVQSLFKSHKLNTYYRKLKKDEDALKEVESLYSEEQEPENEKSKKRKRCQCIQLKVSTAARLTLSANFLLFFLKLAASIQSGSLAVISSLLDSALDLFSGVVIAVTSYLIQHSDPYYYPIGRNRLLPVAIIITAAVMGTASLQIATTAIEDIASGSITSDINAFSGTIIGLTIILKGTLFILCYQVDSAAVKALATDHRNDVASNLVALAFGLLGTYVWKYLDPLGALLLTLYIIFNWVLVGREQLRNLVGHRADRRFVSKIIYIAKEHSEKIVKVDTVRAYTFGINYLVEVHVVLDPSMPLVEAHDIGESLQLKIERLKEVERAFVHLDFESEHGPETEHIPPSPTD